MRNSGKPILQNCEVDVFSTGVSAPARSDSDPAINAAFMAFHRHTAAKCAGLPRRSLLGAGGWAFAALSVFGFGGGLMLASFSFNAEPEAVRVAAARPPEMIYTAPAESGHTPERATAVIGAATTQHIVAAVQTPVVTREEDQQIAPEEAGQAETSDALFAYSDAPLPMETMNFTAATRLMATGLAQLPTSDGGYETGYDAVELPMVPEASPGAIVAAGLVLLIAATHFVRNRRAGTAA